MTTSSDRIISNMGAVSLVIEPDSRPGQMFVGIVANGDAEQCQHKTNQPYDVAVTLRFEAPDQHFGCVAQAVAWMDRRVAEMTDAVPAPS